MNSHLLRSYLANVTEIPDSEWARFEGSLKEAQLPPGSYFIQAGQPAEHIFFVTRGLLESLYIEEDGKERIKRFCPELTMAAPYADLICKRPSTCFIRAVEDSEGLLIDYPFYKSLMESHMCWQKIGRIIAEMEFVEREEREKAFMLWDSRKRYDQFTKKHPNLIGRVPKNRIASYLNMNPVTLSRLIHKD